VVSRCLSATGIRFSVILFPPGSWALLTVGLPDLSPDPDGVTAFRTHEQRPARAPSDPGDDGAHPDRGDYRSGACRFAAASPCTLPHFPSTGISHNEASTRVQAIRPSGLPLACGRPDGTGRPWALPPGFAPRRPGAERRTPGWGQAIEHGPGTTAQLTSADLQSDSSLNACDLVSHVANPIVSPEALRDANAIVASGALSS
jgi:hypothetical protein